MHDQGTRGGPGGGPRGDAARGLEERGGTRRLLETLSDRALQRLQDGRQVPVGRGASAARFVLRLEDRAELVDEALGPEVLGRMLGSGTPGLPTQALPVAYLYAPGG